MRLPGAIAPTAQARSADDVRRGKIDKIPVVDMTSMAEIDGKEAVPVSLVATLEAPHQ